jgi:lipoate-protein ligase A
MIYIESQDTDPRHNLAIEQFIIEQFVFDSPDRDSCFMLWQNHNSIIIGKNQNTYGEINADFVKTHAVTVVRRLSGGGAVYHDLGNINWTFISPAGKNKAMNFAEFCKPMQEALISLGVPTEISGRNDMTVGGKKISGSAQLIRNGRILHHGTLLYDTDLDALSESLTPGADAVESRGIKSARSRVANIRPSMKTDMNALEFKDALKRYFFNSFSLTEYFLSAAENADVQKLAEQVYSQWAWNYGASPPHNIRRARLIEGCGAIEIFLNVGTEGLIRNIAFYGDFFGYRDTGDLSAMLANHHLEYNELKALLETTDISQFFNALDIDTFLSLLLE